MILQSAPGELTEEPVPGILSQQNANPLLQVSIILKKLGVPVGVRIHEKARDPEPAGPPAHRTVSPQGQDRVLRSSPCRWKPRPDISRGQKSGHRRAVHHLSVALDPIRGGEPLILFVPSDGRSSGQGEELAPSWQRDQFCVIGQGDAVSGSAGHLQVGMAEDLA
jgi:hypothetical protein